MKKYFIDLGCNDGKSIIEFYNWYQLVGNPNEFKVIAFDPQKFDEEWANITSHYGVKFHQCAVSDYNGVAKLCLDKNSESQTISEDKKNFNNYEKIEVTCIDFSEFIKDLEGFIMVKMDIEGEEYRVLEKMIKDGTDKNIDILLVEFHDNKMKNDYYTRAKKIRDHFGNKIKEWR